MSQTEWNRPGEKQVVVESSEQQLRAEIEELRRQLNEQQRMLQHGAAREHAAARPSSRTLWMLAAVVLCAVVAAFLTGYVPYRKRESMLVAEASAQVEALPVVTVSPVRLSAARSELVLPGNIQAMTEAPILARADGYIKRRYVDIGDRVRAGQLVAEIDAPEIDQQVAQAKASLQQTQSALEQARANYRQGKTNEELARVTAGRWGNLLKKGVVSRQENDTYQAQYQAQLANTQALEKAIASAQSNVAAAEANLARLTELQGYKQVRAPFAGVITVRNVDVGALITSGSTLLFRVAQTNPLRTYINVPQADASSLHVGQAADLLVPDLPGKHFSGTVTRTSSSLDPSSRTLLAEVQVPNPDGTLLPGTYCQVDLNTKRATPPALIPGDALVVRSDGPQVAVVLSDQRIHFQKLVLGRDYGDRIEVISGVEEGQSVVANPSDAVHEGVKVKPVPATEKPAPKAAGSPR